MTLSVTDSAECNQILRDIPAELTPRPHMMNLQVLRGTAVLASPAISLKHLFSNRAVFFRVQFESRLLLEQAHPLSGVHNKPYG